MVKYLKRKKLPKLTEEEIENPNITITSKEIKLVLKKQLTKEAQAQIALPANSNKHLEDN